MEPVQREDEEINGLVLGKMEAPSFSKHSPSLHETDQAAIDKRGSSSSTVFHNTYAPIGAKRSSSRKRDRQEISEEEMDENLQLEKKDRRQRSENHAVLHSLVPERFLKEPICMDEHVEALLIDAQSKYNIFQDNQVIVAVAYASKAHQGQMLEDGSPIFDHCMGTAILLAELDVDPAIIIAGLLHDTPSDNGISHKELVKTFGEPIADLVLGVAKLSYLSKVIRRREQDFNVYATEMHNMLLAMVDIRALLIKIAGRINQMTKIEAVPLLTRRLELASETLQIFAPLAGRIGVMKWKERLEDICFKVLHKEEYDKLEEKVSDGIVEYALSELREALDKEKCWYVKLTSRRKGLYGIYKKMALWNLSFEDMKDLYGLRIIVESEHMCYEVAEIVRKLWEEEPEFFRDYIRNPKPQGYRSLHMIVKTSKGKEMEIQIRTTEMHEASELTHWVYKEGDKEVPEHVRRMVQWARRTIKWHCNVSKACHPVAEMTKASCLGPNHVYEFDDADMSLYIVVIATNKMVVEELKPGTLLKDVCEKFEKTRVLVNGKQMNDFGYMLNMGDELNFS